MLLLARLGGGPSPLQTGALGAGCLRTLQRAVGCPQSPGPCGWALSAVLGCGRATVSLLPAPLTGGAVGDAPGFKVDLPLLRPPLPGSLCWAAPQPTIPPAPFSPLALRWCPSILPGSPGGAPRPVGSIWSAIWGGGWGRGCWFNHQQFS